MGLFILPARLKQELECLGKAILAGADLRADEMLEKHADWVDEFKPNYADINEENVMDIIRYEVGLVFSEVLEDAGVYKCTEEGRAAGRNPGI